MASCCSLPAPARAGSSRIGAAPDPTSQEIKPPAKGPKKNRFNAGGADFSPDGHWLYWSGGEDGRVYLFDTAQGQLVTEIPLNVEVAGREYEDSFAVDLKMSKDGRYLFCADVTNFRVVVIDTEQRKVAGSVQVGRYPYALAVEGDRLYVANIGLFEYSPVPARTNAQFDVRGLTIPPFGYPSPEARDGVVFEGRRDSRPGRAQCAGIVFRLGRRYRLPAAAESHQPLEDRLAGRRALGQRQDGRRQRAELPRRQRRVAFRLQREQRHDSTD